MELEKVTGSPEQIESFHCPLPTGDAVRSGASACGLTASLAAVYFGGVLFPAHWMLHQFLHAPETTSSWRGKLQQALGAAEQGDSWGSWSNWAFYFSLLHFSCWFIILLLGKERELCLMSSEVRPGLGPQKAAGINN